MILVDVNLLVYAYNTGAPQHEASRSWVESVFSTESQVALPWSVLLGFLRVTTLRGILSAPLSPTQATRTVDSWLRLPNVVELVPGPHHWKIFRRLLLATGTAGNLTSDAHLAALAIEHGCTLYSADNDFRRFSGLDHVDPLRLDAEES